MIDQNPDCTALELRVSVLVMTAVTCILPCFWENKVSSLNMKSAAPSFALIYCHYTHLGTEEIASQVLLLSSNT